MGIIFPEIDKDAKIKLAKEMLERMISILEKITEVNSGNRKASSEKSSKKTETSAKEDSKKSKSSTKKSK